MKKHFLTFVSNFKHENDYIVEWLDYHIMMGVDHFYLYDQDGGDAARRILEPYINKGLVTRHLWTMWEGTRFDGPTRFYQRAKNHIGYAHAAKNYSREFQWIMKIDVDEFLFPTDDSDSLRTWLQTINTRNVKGIRVPRIDFGSSGHLTKPSTGVLESYLKREVAPSNHKDLANGDFLSSNRFCYSSHWWRYKLWKPGRFLKADGYWRINHYYIKSREEYLSRQNPSRGRPVSEAGFIEKDGLRNQVVDHGMLKYVS